MGEPFGLPAGAVASARPLTGNEAIARGAWEAGVKVAAAYPGTPSTEILESLATYPAEDLHAQWSTNEKVALDVAMGASFAGRRALAAMKHVGLNVAADAFMSLTYIGVNGGLVLAICDDPGIHSSQNEQDTRLYGVLAGVPVLEPSDAQEALDFTKLAFELSENFDTPVIVRGTTRLSHTRSPVVVGDRSEPPAARLPRTAVEERHDPGPRQAAPRRGTRARGAAEGLFRGCVRQPLGGRRQKLRRGHGRDLLPLCARGPARRQRAQARRLLAAAGRTAAALLRVGRASVRRRRARAGDRKGDPCARLRRGGQAIFPARGRVGSRARARRIRAGRHSAAAPRARHLGARAAGASAGALRRLSAHIEFHGGAGIRCARRRRYRLLHLGLPRSAARHRHHGVDGLLDRQCHRHGQGGRAEADRGDDRRFDFPACRHSRLDRRRLQPGQPRGAAAR